MFPATRENPNFLLHRETPFPYHQNPTSSTVPDDDSQFLYFPSPFLDDPPLSQIFAHHHHPQQQLKPKLLQPANGEEPDSTIKKRSVGLKPRKRTGKKDRHSKIKTAQGVRDRRMRLSVQIARKFFDLQDMLGFDKASKTIEWLFSNSKNAIKELSTKHNANNNGASSSSCTEGERVSAMEDSSKKEKADCNLQARESREKARARARERTKEKTMKTKQFSSNPNNNSLEMMEELGFPSNPSPFLEEEPNSYVTNLDLVQEKSAPHEASDSIASIFECYHNLYGGISADTDSPNSFMGNFLGNWDLDTDPRILISPFSGYPDSNI